MTPAEIKAYRDAGFTLEQIIQIGEVQEAKHSEAREKAAARREKHRQWKQAYRDKQKALSTLSTSVHVDNNGHRSKPNEINGHVHNSGADVSYIKEEGLEKGKDKYADFGYIDDTINSREGTPAKVKSKARKVATRLAADWAIPDEWIAVAAKIGLSEEQARLEAEKMRDWSLSAPGGAKLDWLAAWRNWARKAHKDTPKASALQRQYGQITNLEAVKQARAKMREEAERVRKPN